MLTRVLSGYISCITPPSNHKVVMPRAFPRSPWPQSCIQATSQCLPRSYSTPTYSPPAPAGASEAEVQSAKNYCSSLLQYDTLQLFYIPTTINLASRRTGNSTLPPIPSSPSSLLAPNPPTSPSAPSTSKHPASPTRSQPPRSVPCACNSGGTT